MLNFWQSKMGTVPQKGGYHSIYSMWGHVGPLIQDKQFPSFKQQSTLACQKKQNSSQNSSSNVIMEINSSRESQEQCNAPISNTIIANNSQPCCSNKKKKKRKRKRKKKGKTQTESTTTGTEVKSQRSRQISITESEDSFVICFDEDLGASDQISELSEEFDSLDSSIDIPNKKVHFAEDGDLCEVHTMVMWSYAYHAARKGPWEEYARDRWRFQQRIKNTEALIGHIFDPEHREMVYFDRFA